MGPTETGHPQISHSLYRVFMPIKRRFFALPGVLLAVTAHRDFALFPSYTKFATITSGMSVIDKVAAGGATAGPDGHRQIDGPPRTKLIIESLTVTG